MRSVFAVGIGVLLAFVVAMLSVFGIVAPVFTRFFSNEAALNAFFPAVLLVFAAALAFYFGGMLASYKAPGHRVLHGTLVAPVAFTISPAVNLMTGEEAFPALAAASTAALAGAVLLASVAASFAGARRGRTIHAHNHAYFRREQARKRARERREQAESAPRGEG
jgi:hypothetical protein